MKLSKVCLAITALSVSAGAFAHGYVSQPAARAYLCNAGMDYQNKNCGAGPLYEMQSVEGPDGFPQPNRGPADGKIASAGVASMSLLDEQSDTRWTKQPFKAGKQLFTWTYTAPHKTKDWTYFITKADWDPNQPLTRNAFESQPFCRIVGKNALPQLGINPGHECIVPERQGYHVILAAWDVSDTAATFYNVIDVDFGGTNQPDPGEVEDPGDECSPGADIPAGWQSDKVYNAGDIVSWKGKEYRARWWTKGNEPGSNDVWEQVE